MSTRYQSHDHGESLKTTKPEIYSSSIPENDVLTTDFNETTQLLGNLKKNHETVGEQEDSNGTTVDKSFTVGYSADLVTDGKR